MAWISLDEVRAYADFTAATDAQLLGFLETSVEVVESLAGKGESTTVTEYHDGGSGVIFLDEWPVLDVTTVTEIDGATSQTIAYEAEDGGVFTTYGFRWVDGVLTRTSSGYPAKWGRRVKVVYEIGYATPPARMVFAVKEGVRLLWTKAQGMGATEYPVSLSEFDIAYLTNILGDLHRPPRMA